MPFGSKAWAPGQAAPSTPPEAGMYPHMVLLRALFSVRRPRPFVGGRPPAGKSRWTLPPAYDKIPLKGRETRGDDAGMTIKKQMIAGKLVELLEHKPVDKITVKELVAACGISRQGFYYHFQDIMDVVEWITAQALQRAVEVSLAADSPQDALKNVILSLMNNRKLIYHLMASQRRSEIERLLVQAMRTYLEKVLRAKARGLPIRPGDLEAAINFYSYGLVGMLMEDLMKEVDVDALADQLCRLLTGDIWGLAQPS